MFAEAHHILPRNQILNALPFEEIRRIAPKLKKVKISSSEILYRAGEPINYVYFYKLFINFDNRLAHRIYKTAIHSRRIEWKSDVSQRVNGDQTAFAADLG